MESSSNSLVDIVKHKIRQMKICRFCLDEEGPFTNIYERQIKDKQSVPLPLQLMACVAIEVFQSDGMPQLICHTCRLQTYQAYTFKSNCKKADDALKVFLATGTLMRPWTTSDVTSSDVPKKSFQSTKRHIDSTLESPNKRHKKDSDQELLTLNYSGSFSQNETSLDESQFLNESMESTSFENTIEETINDESETDIGFAAPEDETVLNPTLKVNQVQTDCFPCNECERSFPLKQLLDLHLTNHTRERNFTCDECDKSFFTKYDLSKHLLTHNSSKPFTCVVCQKTFARESLLHRHEKVHIDVPKYLCTQCDRTFLTGEDLDAHTAKHKKKRPFACRICQKSFVFKQGLERHEQTHNNVRPHKCNYCEASFTSAIKLTRHVTSHAGLRPYPCKLCGRTFLLSHHLTRHMRSHYAAQQADVAQIGQHKCDVCSMSFRRKDSLINHSAIHSMVNLKCVICNTEFDNVVKVKEHITTHLSDLPFPCEKCEYSFETAEQLEEHEVKHVEMEYEEQIEQEIIAEAKHAADQDDDDDEEDGNGEINSDYSGDDIAEFTITNDINNPEVVRRSKRPKKISNYAEFLKTELGSDLDEDELNDSSEYQESEQQAKKKPEDDILAEESENSSFLQEDETIKPIVRTEGTKVYSRKNTPDKPRVKPQVKVAPTDSRVTQPQTVSSLDTINKDITKYQNKEYFNMKIGDKTLIVQKLIVTKEQMQAMAKEGKIEKKGNTLLLKKSSGQSLQNVNLDALLNHSSFKQQMKKTYQRKIGTTLEGSPGLAPSVVNSTLNFSNSFNLPNIDESM